MGKKYFIIFLQTPANSIIVPFVLKQFHLFPFVSRHDPSKKRRGFFADSRPFLRADFQENMDHLICPIAAGIQEMLGKISVIGVSFHLLRG